MANDELVERVCDSGFTAQAIEDAEALWLELPVFPRKWHQMQTHEKALACRAVQRFRAKVEADQRERDAVIAETYARGHRLILKSSTAAPQKRLAAAAERASNAIATAIRNQEPTDGR